MEEYIAGEASVIGNAFIRDLADHLHLEDVIFPAIKAAGGKMFWWWVGEFLQSVHPPYREWRCKSICLQGPILLNERIE